MITNRFNGKDSIPVNDLFYCCDCSDFLYEDTSGYGICTQDNDRHSCRERCMYGKENAHLSQAVVSTI